MGSKVDVSKEVTFQLRLAGSSGKAATGIEGTASGDIRGAQVRRAWVARQRMEAGEELQGWKPHQGPYLWAVGGVGIFIPSATENHGHF